MEERDRTPSFLGHLGKYSNPLLMFLVAVTQSGKRVELLPVVVAVASTWMITVIWLLSVTWCRLESLIQHKSATKRK